MKTWQAATLSALLAAGGTAQAADLQPFTAEYAVKYSTMSVGGSRLELRREGSEGRWILESRANASGIAKLLASGTLVQTSWLAVEAEGVRPLRFRFDDGMQRSQEDVSLEFDWQRGRVSGTAKGKPVDVGTVPGLQDPVSIQIATMVALQRGQSPGSQPMIEGHRIKTYEYRRLREEQVKTAAGTFDTVVYASSRQGSERETRMWLAPSLGYLAVQVEQYRKDKRLFSMYLERFSVQR